MQYIVIAKENIKPHHEKITNVNRARKKPKYAKRIVPPPPPTILLGDFYSSMATAHA